MNYIQLSISVSDPNAIDFVLADLHDHPVESLEINDLVVCAYFPINLYETINLHDFPLTLKVCSISIKSEEIEHENWNIEWESSFPPVFIDKKVLVKGPFHFDLDLNLFDYVIEMTPKMSFGTGHHPTTYLMMIGLLKHDLSGKRILDMGCGTAILAVLAIKAGADYAIGVDIDPYSSLNAIEILEVNNVSEQAIIHTGGAELISPRGIAHGPYDFIFANINRNILLTDMESYSKASNNGGILELSGFYNKDVNPILKRAKDCGYILAGKASKEGWIHLTLTYQPENT